MARTCKAFHVDGNYCGQPVSQNNASLCPVHEGSELGAADARLLLGYVAAQSGRSTIDLCHLKLKDIKFGAEFSDLAKSLNRPILFSNTHLLACNFTHNEIPVNLSFRNSILEDCLFLHLVFWGDTLEFDESTLVSDEPMFVDCRIDTIGKVSFARSSIRVSSEPFSRCYIKATQVDFIDCAMSCDRFYLKCGNGPQPQYDSRYLNVKGDNIFLTGLKLDGHFECATEYDCQQIIPVVNFSVVNFSQVHSATFLRADLSRMRFIYSNLEQVSFIDVKWPERDERRIIYDEICPPKDTSTDELRRLYSQLKKNYADRQDYVRADQWYYRETECRSRMLKENPGSSRWAKTIANYGRVVFRLYLLVSDYGENHLKALLWIVLIWILAAWAYFFTGVRIGDELIQYSIIPDSSNFVAVLKDFMLTLIFSVAAAALQIGKGFSLGSTASHVVFVCELLLMLVLVPLFLFALRRKFKR